MGQYRYTGLSGGGPTYVNDPRVDEAVALGQLLLQRQQAANAQADRLFKRKQEAADFDERRRQFNEEQKRLADAQKMQQADADRRQTLAQQELELRQAAQQEAARQFGVEQQGRGEDRLFARESLASRDANVAADNRRADAARAEQVRQFEAARGDRAAEIDTARGDKRKADTMDRLDQIRREALRQAEIAGADEQAINKDIARLGEKALDRKIDAAEFDRRQGLLEQKQRATAEKVLGTDVERRDRGLSNLLARFEEDVKTAKSQKDEQTKQEVLAQAVQDALFPPPDVEGRNNVDVLAAGGRPEPVWRPSPDELERLKPALLEIMARHFPAVARTGFPMVEIPGSGAPGAGNGLLEQLASLVNRAGYHVTGGNEFLNSHLWGVPRWVEDLGKQALEETLKRNEKSQALFKR